MADEYLFNPCGPPSNEHAAYDWRERGGKLWDWLHRGAYVITWCNRPWASRRTGEITDT
jgi:hypothetical protein